MTAQCELARILSHIAHGGGSDPKLAPPWGPAQSLQVCFFEQKASHNRGIRRGQRGNQEFYRFKVGCLGLRSHTQQQAILGL